MTFGQLGRIAIEVDDLESVADDLRTVLGMEYEIHDLSDTMGIVAGVGRDGIELVQRAVPEPVPARY